MNNRNRTLATLRGLMKFKKGTPVPLDEERRRVLPALEKLAGGRVPVSIDTQKPELMREAIAAGASMVVVAVQAFVIGSYWPPVFNEVPVTPPQITIRVPVHTAVWEERPHGAPRVVVAVHVSATGSY